MMQSPSFGGQTLGGGVLDKLARFPHVGPSSSVHRKRFRRRRLFRQQARILMDDERGRIIGRQSFGRSLERFYLNRE
jgi:hypothetical protein